MTRVMGKANDFSVIDIEKINRMYSCYQQPNNLQPQPLQPVKPWLVPRPFPQQPYLPPIQEIVDEGFSHFSFLIFLSSFYMSKFCLNDFSLRRPIVSLS